MAVLDTLCSKVLVPLIIFLTVSDIVNSISNVVTVTETLPEGMANSTSDEISLEFEQRLQNVEFHIRYWEELTKQWQQNFKSINKRLTKLEEMVAKNENVTQAS